MIPAGPRARGLAAIPAKNVAPGVFHDAVSIIESSKTTNSKITIHLKFLKQTI